MTDHDNPRDRIAEPIWQNTMLTIEGAKQIAQTIIDELRTDEAIERVARGICRRNWPKNDDFVHYWHWYCDDFRSDARAAITALLGDA